MAAASSRCVLATGASQRRLPHCIAVLSNPLVHQQATAVRNITPLTSTSARQVAGRIAGGTFVRAASQRPLGSYDGAIDVTFAVTSVEAELPKSVGGRRICPASEAHGGDDVHSVSRLICDFSTTTNAMGPVPRAIAGTRQLFEDMEISFTTARGGNVKAILEEHSECIAHAPAIEHYPQRHDEELGRMTVEFLGHAFGEAAGDFAESRLLFGNGASELIDLLARAAPDGPYCAGPHVDAQYMEYVRACKSAKRDSVSSPRDASILCLVNPTNPTGDFIERAEMEAYIEGNATPGSWVVVDESMLFWAGPDWHQRGVSDAFVDKMAQHNVCVFRVYSWTKIFACTGLRIGSVVCPSEETKLALTSIQVPWSVTAFARTYLKESLLDRDFLERTWANTPKWREFMATRLQRVYPTWKIMGQDWLSFLWIDTGDASVAEEVYQTALDCGCPVRHAAGGYNLPTFLRLAVRRPSDFAPLHQALLRLELQKKEKGKVHFGTYADVDPGAVAGVELVHIDDLKPHELILGDRAGKLQNYLEDLPVKHLPAIIVCSETHTVIDGHHRLQLFKSSGMSIVPAIMLNYAHEDILVNPPGSARPTTKEDVIRSAVKGEPMQPKSTQHMVRSRSGHIMPIIVLAPQIAELAE